MPKRLSGCLYPAQESFRGVPGKGNSGIRGQDACARTSRPKFMRPANFAGLVVDCFQHAFAPEPVVGTRPPVGAIRRLVEINAVAGVGSDDKQASLGIKAGRTIVGQAGLVRAQSSGRRATVPWPGWESDGLACPCPVPSSRVRRERSADSCHWCDPERKNSRYGGLHQHLPRLSLEGSIDQHGISTASQS